MDETCPVRIVIVSNGDAADPSIVSGVPYFVAQAFERRTEVQLETINAKPARALRWLARAITWHPVRTVWDAQYVHSTALARLRSWTRDWRLRRLEFSPDLIIHVRSWYYPPRGRHAAFIDATSDMLQGVTSSWTSPPKTHARKRAVETGFYHSADLIFCASHDAASDLRHGYGVDSGKIHVVGGGVNFDSYPEEPPINTTSSKRILFVGKDPERKGLPELLEAFVRLRRTHEDATLLVVGCWWDTDIPGVEFRKAVKSRLQMSRLYQSSDIFCLPSRQESFGLVVPEAAAHGLPCIVSSVGELPRLVKHGVTGLVVTPQHPDELFAALEALVSDPNRAQVMGKQGWEDTKTLTWDSVVQKMQAAILDLPFESYRRSDMKLGAHPNVR